MTGVEEYVPVRVRCYVINVAVEFYLFALSTFSAKC